MPHPCAGPNADRDLTLSLVARLNGRSSITISYENPVLDRNFPDPGVVNIDGVYYAFGTNGGGGNVQAATSPDLVRLLHRSVHG